MSEEVVISIGARESCLLAEVTKVALRAIKGDILTATEKLEAAVVIALVSKFMQEKTALVIKAQADKEGITIEEAFKGDEGMLPRFEKALAEAQRKERPH